MTDSPIELAPTNRQLHADPARPAWIGVLVLVGFAGILAAWGALAPVSGAAIASGSLHVEGQRQAVEHPYGGVVESLMVEEGDRVEKGQLLFTLSDSEPAAQLEILQAERDALLATEARLLAERDGRDTLALGQALRSREDAPSAAQAIANERAIMAARARQFESEVAILERKGAQLEKVAAGTRAQLEGLERRIALLEEELDGARQLREAGHTPIARVRELEAEAAALEAERGTRLAGIARAEEAIGETEIELARIERTRLSEITDRLRAVQASLLEVGPKILNARDVLARTEVRAPATGAVVALQLFTEGGVVGQGDRVLEIVPSANPLIVEARLHLADVQDVEPGDSAEVELVGINRAERPQITGTVLTVSADQLTDERTGEGYYSVRVAMDEEDVRAGNVDLQAGMPAELIMTTTPRTFLEYLVSPLTDEITRAFRED